MSCAGKPLAFPLDKIKHHILSHFLAFYIFLQIELPVRTDMAFLVSESLKYIH